LRRKEIGAPEGEKKKSFFLEGQRPLGEKKALRRLSTGGGGGEGTISPLHWRKGAATSSRLTEGRKNREEGAPSPYP